MGSQQGGEEEGIRERGGRENFGCDIKTNNKLTNKTIISS